MEESGDNAHTRTLDYSKRDSSFPERLTHRGDPTYANTMGVAPFTSTPRRALCGPGQSRDVVVYCSDINFLPEWRFPEQRSLIAATITHVAIADG